MEGVGPQRRRRGDGVEVVGTQERRRGDGEEVAGRLLGKLVGELVGKLAAIWRHRLIVFDDSSF